MIGPAVKVEQALTSCAGRRHIASCLPASPPGRAIMAAWTLRRGLCRASQTCRCIHDPQACPCA